MENAEMGVREGELYTLQFIDLFEYFYWCIYIEYFWIAINVINIVQTNFDEVTKFFHISW